MHNYAGQDLTHSDILLITAKSNDTSLTKSVMFPINFISSNCLSFSNYFFMHKCKLLSMRRGKPTVLNRSCITNTTQLS